MKSLRSLGTSALVALIALATSCNLAAGEVTIGSWNVARLGHGTQKDFQAVAKIASRFDLVALQEVMTEQAISRLISELTALTHTPWTFIDSGPIGRSTYRERYVFLWKLQSGIRSQGAVVYIDQGDHFEREPFAARFLFPSLSLELSVSNIHLKHGRHHSERQSEAIALVEYIGWIKGVHGEAPHTLVVGDFNLPPNDAVWRLLPKHLRFLILNGGSTLSSKNGRFANLYDNALLDTGTKGCDYKATIYNYPAALGINHMEARATISDHAPVAIAIKC